MLNVQVTSSELGSKNFVQAVKLCEDRMCENHVLNCGYMRGRLRYSRIASALPDIATGLSTRVGIQGEAYAALVSNCPLGGRHRHSCAESEHAAWCPCIWQAPLRLGGGRSRRAVQHTARRTSRRNTRALIARAQTGRGEPVSPS